MGDTSLLTSATWLCQFCCTSAHHCDIVSPAPLRDHDRSGLLPERSQELSRPLRLVLLDADVVAIGLTRPPDSGPPVVGVRRPACWAGGHDHDEASPSYARADPDHRQGGPQRRRPVRKLREGDRLLNEGKDLTEVLRELEVSESSWNRWRSQYGGMKANEAKRLRELESENARLKRLLAEAGLDKSMLKELAEDAPIDQVGL
jgi:putative transposase